MFCYVLTGVLFCTVIICRESLGVDESESSPVVQLNEILKNPEWEKITHVGAKCRLAVNRNGSFNGKDLLESDTNLVTSTENFRHYMVTHLVGCVYVNAVVKFLNLIRIIFEEFWKAKKNVSNQVYYLKKKCLGKKKRGINSVDEPLEEKGDNTKDIIPTTDFHEAWTIFNYALRQLFDNRQTFGRMFSAMRYLIDTMPPGLYALDLLGDVMPCLERFKYVSNNITEVLGFSYTGPMDPDYNRKVSVLPRKLLSFLNGHTTMTMESFLKKFCAVSETSASESISTQQRSQVEVESIFQPTPIDAANQCGTKITQLMEEVCDNYYSKLGFMYNEAKQTTSFFRIQPSQPIP